MSETFLLTQADVVFKNTGGDVDFTLTSLADNAGRISSLYTLGAENVARRASFAMWIKTEWQSTPDLYGSLDIFLSELPDFDITASWAPGDEGITDAAIGDVDSIGNMRYIGAAISENAAGGETIISRPFTFTTVARAFSIVAINRGGAALSSTASDHEIRLVPYTWEAQA